MKIALIGYGKMGHAIEKIALERGHSIVCRIDADNSHEFGSEAFAGADIAIEFTAPAMAVDNYLRAWQRGVKVVSGTTGWLDRRDEVQRLCLEQGATLLWSSNFSIGVNVFFALNRCLASMMSGLNQYRPLLTETHHIHKLDHPSGTAITLAEGIISADDAVNSWAETDTPTASQLPVKAIREGEVPGTHTVEWTSGVDRLTITHQAFSREGFALGAVMAAEWVASGQSGWLTIEQFMASLLPCPQLYTELMKL